jgi:hypothetical protein
MGWTCAVPQMGKTRNAYRTSMGKCLGLLPLGRPIRRKDDTL